MTANKHSERERIVTEGVYHVAAHGSVAPTTMRKGTASKNRPRPAPGDARPDDRKPRPSAPQARPSRDDARKQAPQNSRPPARKDIADERRPAPRAGKHTGLVVSDTAARAVLRGHPWVYRDALDGVLAAYEPGDVVELKAESGAFLARGYLDPESPIAARVLTLDERTRVDESLALRRLDAAIALRKTMLAGQSTDAYRLCNGEGDGLPGLVIDRYGDWAVLRTDGQAATSWAKRLRPALFARLAREGVLGLAMRERGAEVDLGWAGDRLPDALFVTEHGMLMEVDLAQGQKTGAFLDQRENRRRVREMAKGRRVLNLFSYAGGFSLAAALGGASEVTSVDIAAGGHASAKRSFHENGIDAAKHRFITSDVFVFLETARAKGQRWDLVISDPPSFAPSERAKLKALSAYRKLHTACLEVLSPGGIFCAASCSSHVQADDFIATLDGHPGLKLCELHGQPPDHTTIPAWWEGQYLKFAVLFRAEPF